MKNLKLFLTLFSLILFTLSMQAQTSTNKPTNDNSQGKLHEKICSPDCSAEKKDLSETLESIPIVALDGVDISPSYGDRSNCCKKETKTSTTQSVGKQVKDKRKGKCCKKGKVGTKVRA